MDNERQLVQGLFHPNAHLGMWNLDSSDVQSLYDIYTVDYYYVVGSAE